MCPLACLPCRPLPACLQWTHVQMNALAVFYQEDFGQHNMPSKPPPAALPLTVLWRGAAAACLPVHSLLPGRELGRTAAAGGAAPSIKALAVLSPFLIPPCVHSLLCSCAAEGPVHCLHLAGMSSARAAPAGRRLHSQPASQSLAHRAACGHPPAPVPPLHPTCPLLAWPGYVRRDGPPAHRWRIERQAGKPAWLACQLYY